MLILRAENLSNQSGIVHGFFGRTGGVSTGIYESLNCGPGSNDSRAAVIENRRRAADALGTAALVTLGQIHGAHVLTVTAPWRLGETPADDSKHIPLADAMVTKTRGIALGILAADCAPVLLADGAAGVIGAAHAGWKGALGGVIEATVAAMEKLGAHRTRIAAAIGPCISQANYEVGAEFRARFAADEANARFFQAGSRALHHQFDLAAFAANRLNRAGVDNVSRQNVCTYAHEAEFYSFRRATHRGEADYGRELSAIVLV